MKQIIAVSLVCMLILQAIPHTALAEDASNTKELELQLQALGAYLSRLSGKEKLARLSDEEMKRVIDEGTLWLLNAQEPSGHFKYEYVPYEDAYRNDDNIVRQAGALYALGEVYRRQTQKDPAIAEAIEKAMVYFRSLSLENDDEGWTCVANSEGSTRCKLGSTALVLAGILGYVEGKPEARKQYEDLIADYTAYLLLAQKEEGGFSGEYSTRTGFSDEESPFFNGEALLALVRAYQYENDAKVKQGIDTAFSYLETKEFESPLYLWIMAALKDMHALWGNERYIAYAEAFTTWRMARATRTWSDRNYCAYIEGVASAYSVLKDQPQEKIAFIRKDIDAFNAYHSTLQIKEDDTYKVLQTESKPSLVRLQNIKQAQGGFLTAHSQPTQRIDFTQHCISAYVQTLVDIDGGRL